MKYPILDFIPLLIPHILTFILGITKTHERIFEWYYDITKKDVAWVINRCNICNATAKVIEKPLIQPIISKGPGYRITIDLMDFRSFMDGIYY
jgi:hypothetical protein